MIHKRDLHETLRVVNSILQVKLPFANHKHVLATVVHYYSLAHRPLPRQT